MPQMMPMWWLLIFLVMVMIFLSSMSVMSEYVIFTPLKGKGAKTELSSWWAK